MIALGDVPFDDRGLGFRRPLRRQVQRHFEQFRVHQCSALYSRAPRTICLTERERHHPPEPSARRSPQCGGCWADSATPARGRTAPGRSGAANSRGGHFSAPSASRQTTRNHLVAQPLRGPALLNHQQPARLADRLDDRPKVHRLEHEGVPDLDRHRAGGRGRQGLVDHRAEGHQRHVGSFGIPPRAPHRFQVPVEIDLARLAPVEQLVLEDQARVRIVKTGHQGLERFLGGGRIEQLQAGKARPQALELPRVKGPHRQPAAARQTQQQRRGPPGAKIPTARVQPQLRGDFGGKIGKLELEDRPPAHLRGPQGKTHRGRLAESACPARDRRPCRSISPLQVLNADPYVPTSKPNRKARGLCSRK